MSRVFRCLTVVAMALLLVSGCWPLSRKKPDEVWLLHGLGRKKDSMAQMKLCLEEAGFQTRLWGYASLTDDIESVGHRLHGDLVAARTNKDVKRVHLVTHSMGGIVTRMALTEERPKKLGRVVMLAPPNRGSWLAELLRPWVGNIIPAMSELSDDPSSLVNKLPPLEGVEVGIVAARFDTKAPVSSTYLRGAADHIVVGATHTYIMDRADVCAQTVHFLREGRFRKSEAPDEDDH